MKREVEVQISINSSRNMASSDSLHLFIAATMDNVEYTGYNGEPIHQDVFLGWINEGFNGELLSIGNEKIAKKYAWTFPANWPQNNFETTWSQVEYDISNIAIVAFVQNKYTKEILQVSGKKNRLQECSMNTIFQKNDLWEDIGEIKYRYSKKAKYIRIVISNTSQVSVIIPNHNNINDAIDFVHSKKKWIQKK